MESNADADEPHAEDAIEPDAEDVVEPPAPRGDEVYAVYLLC